MRYLVLVLALLVPTSAAAQTKLADEVRTLISFYRASEQLVNEYNVVGNNQAALVEKYTKFAKGKLDTIVYIVPLTKDTEGKLLGMTTCPPFLNQCLILVDNSRNKSNGQLATLLHEIAHLLQQEYVDTTDEAEIWAETIAWLTQRHLGLNVSRESMSYLANFPDTKLMDFLTKHEDVIRKFAEALAKVAKQ
jgi:hypothetical protein